MQMQVHAGVVQVSVRAAWMVGDARQWRLKAWGAGWRRRRRCWRTEHGRCWRTGHGRRLRRGAGAWRWGVWGRGWTYGGFNKALVLHHHTLGFGDRLRTESDSGKRPIGQVLRVKYATVSIATLTVWVVQAG